MDTVRAWDEGLVPIQNVHPVPARFTKARSPIPVRARFAWATGVEWRQTSAVAWTSDLVLVNIRDKRCNLRGVWLGLADVERVPPACPGGTQDR